MKLLSAVLLLALTTMAVAQVPRGKMPPARPATAAATPLPTEAEVSEFLRRMFGFDPNLTWKVLSIARAEAPGVAHVVAVIGQQPRPVHLYVLPGGKFAVAGEAIPFGTDPFSATRLTLGARANGFARGSATATVTLVEFSDLQCPFCRTAQPVIDRLVTEVPGARLVFQPFPLPMHDWAMKAAAFAECAGQQRPEAFWELIRGFFEDQPNVTAAKATEKGMALASAAGLDAGKLEACLQDPQTTQRIQASIDLGKSVGVGATPTLFINGRRVTAIADLPYEQLKAMVEFEAAEAARKRR